MSINDPAYGKDRQDAALLARRAVIVTFTKLPTALDRNRTSPVIGTKVIFKVSVRRRVRARYRGDHGNVARTWTHTRIRHAELYPLLGNPLVSVSGNHD